MAVYYKWIKGCSSGATLVDGAWTYITWGTNINAGTSMTGVLPKIEIANGRDGSRTDLGYILSNKATNIVVTEDWKFEKKIYVDNIQSYSTDNAKLTIAPKVEIASSNATALKVTGGMSVGAASTTKSITATGTIKATSEIQSDTFMKAGSYIEAATYFKAGSYCQAEYFNATSDIRAKENIVPANYSALALINSLPVYNYNYKTNPSERVTGILAQDLLKAQPKELNLVSNITATGENGDYMSIKNDKLMFVLLKAIQEQQEEINTLKSEIAELKNFK